MNEQIPVNPPVEFKNRSSGLVIFGILTILLGCLCALFVPLMILGQVMTARTTGAPGNAQMLIPGMLMYGILAAALIWLGIGSVNARRWARALLLIFSWSWLIMGVIAVIFMAIALPHLVAAIQSAAPPGQPALPPAARLMIMIIPMLMLSVAFVILPIVWVFFYRSPHVKATCEARDPAPGWTDACPLPVLAISLWLGLGALMMLAMPLAYHAVFPFFGVFASGLPGALLYLGLATVWSYAAWAFYRIQLRGWWLLIVCLCLFSISHILTYSRHDVMELYRLMGYPEAQIEQMQKFSFLTNGLVVWGSVLCLLPFLGYLVYVKRYFRRAT